MTGADDDRARDGFFEAIQEHLDEPLVSAQFFRAPGGFEGSASGLKRVLGRIFRPGDDHPSNRLGAINVLALTRSRVLAFTAGAGLSGFKVKQRIGEWPVEAVSIRSKERTVTWTTTRAGSPAYPETTTSDIVSATLRAHEDPRELDMDFPDNPLTHELIGAIRAAARTSLEQVGE